MAKKQADQINDVALGVLVEKYGDLNAVLKLLDNVKSVLADAATAARNGTEKITHNNVQGTFVPKIWYSYNENQIKAAVGEENFAKFFTKTDITQDNLKAAVKAEVLTEEQVKAFADKKHGNRYLKITDTRDNPVTTENAAEVVASLLTLLPKKED